MAVRKVIRKVSKIIGLTVAVIIGLMVVVVLLLQLPQVRERILALVISKAQKSLPGTLSIKKARWPSLGTVTFDGVMWVDSTATVAAFDELHASFDLKALIKRDIHVKELIARGVRADVPALTRRFAGGKAVKTEVAAEKGNGFPREGALRGAPSVAVDRIELHAPWIRVSSGSVLRDVTLRGNVNLLSGASPSLDLAELSLEETSQSVAIDSLWIAVDLSAPTLKGGGAVRMQSGMVMYLDCHNSEDGSFAVRLTSAPDRDPPDAIGIAVTGTATLDNFNLKAIKFVLEFLTPGTEDLAAYPAIDDAIAGLAPLEGAHGIARGRLETTPSITADMELDVFRSSWLDTLHLSADYRDETLFVDTLVLALEGLGLGAVGLMSPNGMKMAAWLDVAGSTWLTRILPDITPPDSIAANLVIEAERSSAKRDMDVAVRGNAHVNGIPVDTLNIGATIPAEKGQPYGVDLTVGTFGLRLVTHVDVLLSPAIAVTLSRPEVGPPDPMTCYASGKARYDTVKRSVSLNDIRLTGALGVVSINAALDSLRRGDFDVTCDWPSPPSVLTAVFDADTAAWDSLTGVWSRDGPFSVHVGGRLGHSDAGIELTASGSMFLPGPRDLEPIVGTGVPVTDLGPIEIDFATSIAPCDSGQSLSARIDMGRTEWLDTAVVDVEGCGRTIAVDTVLIVFEGLRVSADGGLQNGLWNLTSLFSLADSQLVRRMERLAGREFSLALKGVVRVQGAAGEPRTAVRLGGRFADEQVAIPYFTGRALITRDTLNAAIDAPEGISTDWISMNSVSVLYATDSRSEDFSSGKARLEAHGQGVDLLFILRLLRQEGFGILTDTLYANVSNRTLSSAHPFEININPGDGTYRIDDLLLSGSLGRMQVDGYVSPDSADLEAHLDVAMPRKPGILRITDRLWPDSVRVDAFIGGQHTITARGRISGMTLGEGTDVKIIFELDADTRGTRTSFSIGAPDRSILDMKGRLPRLGRDWKFADGPISADIRLDGYPLPASSSAMWSEFAEEIGRLNGNVAIRGTMSNPEAVAALYCNFLGGRELAKYRLEVDGQYAKGTVTDSALTRIRNQWFQKKSIAVERRSGFTARLTLVKSAQSVLSGELSYPLILSLKPVSIGSAGSGEMLLEIKSNDLKLTDLDPLLPPDIDLEGVCIIDFSAKGNVRNPVFDGKLSTKNVMVAIANNARVSPDLDIAIGGTLHKPSIEGEILIRQALLKMPEIKTEHHPVVGPSILWEIADSTAIDEDSVIVKRRVTGKKVNEGDAPKKLDIDVRITIPGSFWIRGERLNIELSGDLRIVQKGTRLVLTGELKPLEGRLLFMGRFFQIKRGSVFFYGGDEFNPSFDLTLAADVSNVKIEIRLTGTAQKPEVELTSDPQMSESDIMSLLLFGRSMNDLNTSQSEMLQRRTTEVLAVFGIAKLEGPLSQMLGVDMVSFQQSTRNADQSALMVGKYLNSRTMIKYEQGLENTANFLINLEYYLTKRLKLETFIDQASETGIEINWSKEY